MKSGYYHIGLSAKLSTTRTTVLPKPVRPSVNSGPFPATSGLPPSKELAICQSHPDTTAIYGRPKRVMPLSGTLVSSGWESPLSSPPQSLDPWLSNGH